MKNTLLTACALMVTAGCREAPAVDATPAPSRQAARTKSVMPQVLPKVTPLPVRASTPTPARQDSLALEHAQPSVDHLRRAHLLSDEGDLEGALAEARRALFTSPEDEDALALVDKLGGLTGKGSLSVEALSRLAMLRPDDPVPLIRRARYELALGKPEQATDTALEAIGRDETNPEAHHALGRAYLTRGALSGAIQAFRKVLELDPEHGYALNNLGFAYLRANQNAEAVKVLRQAAEKLPHVAYVQNNLGVALEREGSLEEARLAYLRSTELSPKYVKARVNADRVAQLHVDFDLGLELEAPTTAEPELSVDAPQFGETQPQ